MNRLRLNRVARRGMSEEEPQPLSPALYLDLTASMLAAGLSLQRCLLMIADVGSMHARRQLRMVERRLSLGADWQTAWTFSEPVPELKDLQRTLGFLLETGAPTADLLTVMADRQRRHSFRFAEQSAAKLGVHLVVPLGLCSLPAFICLGVIPVLISLVPTLGF